MRRFLAAVIALGFAAPAFAQFGTNPNKVEITEVKIGFPAARFTNERDDLGSAIPIAKVGTWAPVSFRLKVLRGTNAKLLVEIESTDADKARTKIRWPLGDLVRNKQSTGPDDEFRTKGSFIEPSEFEHMPMVKIGGAQSSIKITILAEDDKGSTKSASDAVEIGEIRWRDPSLYTIVSIGSKLPSFTLPGEVAGRQLRNGRIETAAFSSVETMPDHWWAYEAADLVIFATGNCSEDFLKKFFDDNESLRYRQKREALLEWVRRGGKFIFSVARKADFLTPQKAFASFLPVALTSADKVASYDVKFAGFSGDGIKLKNEPRKKLDKDGKPMKDTDGLPIMEPAEQFRVSRFKSIDSKPKQRILTSGNAETPGVVQVSFGLGRFTVVAFDLDTSPFLDLKEDQRAGIWKFLLREAGSEKASTPPDKEWAAGNTPTGYSHGDSEDGASAALRQHSDTFDGVPVISFGWIALFIILYTILIGPVEYIFLKKILGRLELTWITFPLIVFSVSAAAYYTAYSVKGKDLKLNKIDVVDIDVAGGRVYGRTWFTLFSPRPASYTVGVEPKEPWAFDSTDSADRKPETLVDWMGGAPIDHENSGIAGMRSYSYAIDPEGGTRLASPVANGLDAVPVQVWTTKAFTANWSAYLSKDKPAVESELEHLASDPTAVRGKFTIHLPLPGVSQAIAFYKGEPYELDKGIQTGVPVVFNPKLDKAIKGGQVWREKEFKLDSSFYNGVTSFDTGLPGKSGRGGRVTQTYAPTTGESVNLWGILFHESLVKTPVRLQNSSLRTLDESWRLENNTDEVIVLIKLNKVNGPSEEQFSEESSASPTRLWLSGRPGSGPRAPTPGVIQQETYIRLYIPVKPAGKK